MSTGTGKQEMSGLGGHEGQRITQLERIFQGKAVR